MIDAKSRRRFAVLAAASVLVSAPALVAASAAHAESRTCSTAYLPLPDPICTPGALNPDVTQDTIDETICVSGWTATVRPSSSYTRRLKIQQIAEYGYADTDPASYQEDHLVPLELGGDPTDPRNLWPEPNDDDGWGHVAKGKDQVENKLKRAVCAGSVTLADARDAIMTDWTTALSSLGLD